METLTFEVGEEVVQMTSSGPVQILVVQKVLSDRILTIPSNKYVDWDGKIPTTERPEEWALTGQIYWRSVDPLCRDDWGAYVRKMYPGDATALRQRAIERKVYQEIRGFDHWGSDKIAAVAETLGISLPIP